ncbi:MAG: tetratricopeptide repeat protein [Myxococcales bacterium]|nr:tetratricopeptide repeat protein [Myxococcales bacterium]MCB9520332.1 tetratricopeptide repeat protein [Myxococcales bacterium]MCB9530987.1 tetratricopeptide repeat protein [Myxococcales bacterium]MCB9532907.1 tetratricopeptide repeat protein [Myxococcales bacterium]
MRRATRVIPGMIAGGLIAVVGASLVAPKAEATIWQEIITSGGRDLGAQLAAAAAIDDTDMAVAELRRLAALAPDDPMPGLLMLHRLARAGRAGDVLDRADEVPLTSREVEAQVAFFRSFALGCLGRYAEAADVLERSIRYLPELPDRARYIGNLGELLTAAGDFDRAVSFLRDASGSQGRAAFAAALALSGHLDDAHAVAMELASAQGGFALTPEPGAIYIPEGIDALYRALVSDASGDAATAAAETAAFLASPAGVLATPELRTRLGAGTGVQVVTATRFSLSGCAPRMLDVSSAGDAVVARCEAGDVRVVRRGDAGAISQSSLRPELIDYMTTDVAFAPDGRDVLTLMSDGRVVRQRTDDRFLEVVGEPHSFGEPALTPQRFVSGNPSRVLTVGSSQSGFQVIDADASAPTLALEYAPGLNWLYLPEMSRDERTLAVADGWGIAVFTGPVWTRRGSIAISADAWGQAAPWCLSPDGGSVVQIRGSQLVGVSTTTQRPTAVVRVGEWFPEVAAGTDLPVAIRPVGPRTYAVATREAVMVLELSAPIEATAN